MTRVWPAGGRSKWVIGAACMGLCLALPLVAEDKQDGKPEEPKAVEQLKLVNPGFEEGEDTVSGWKRGAPIDGVEYLWDRNIGHDSKCSVAIRKTGQKYSPVAEWTQTVPHSGKTTKLRLSAFVRAEKMQKALLDVTFLPAKGEATHQWAAYIGAKKEDDRPADHTWREYSGVVAVPKDTKELTIGLQVYGPVAVWFDDVKAEYVPDSTPASYYDEKGKPKP